MSHPQCPRVFAAAALLVLGGVCGASRAAAPRTLEAYVQPALQDLSASITVVSHRDAELRKIGKDYPQAYSLTSQEIQFKEPDRMRFQGKKGILTFRTITNGGRKMTEGTGLPLLGQRKTEDISEKPGKADVIADLGVITPGWLTHVNSHWIRTEERDGKTLQVYYGSYKGDHRAHHTWVVDPATKTIVEHIHHNRNEKAPGFRKRLVYSDVKQINGVWVPTRVTMYNSENREAAVMRYERIRVNTGLPDSLFRL